MYDFYVKNLVIKTRLEYLGIRKWYSQDSGKKNTHSSETTLLSVENVIELLFFVLTTTYFLVQGKDIETTLRRRDGQSCFSGGRKPIYGVSGEESRLLIYKTTLESSYTGMILLDIQKAFDRSTTKFYTIYCLLWVFNLLPGSIRISLRESRLLI